MTPLTKKQLLFIEIRATLTMVQQQLALYQEPVSVLVVKQYIIAQILNFPKLHMTLPMIEQLLFIMMVVTLTMAPQLLVQYRVLVSVLVLKQYLIVQVLLTFLVHMTPLMIEQLFHTVILATLVMAPQSLVQYQVLVSVLVLKQYSIVPLPPISQPYTTPLVVKQLFLIGMKATLTMAKQELALFLVRVSVLNLKQYILVKTLVGAHPHMTLLIIKQLFLLELTAKQLFLLLEVHQPMLHQKTILALLQKQSLMEKQVKLTLLVELIKVKLDSRQLKNIMFKLMALSLHLQVIHQLLLVLLFHLQISQ